MSGENFGRGNAQPGAGANDRYAYSGDGGATSANGAGAAGNDRYQYSGDGGRGQPTGGDNSADCNWRPDYSYSSPHARAWLAASRDQANKPVTRDDSGAYTVQFGDSLSGIAARELRDEGQTVDRAHIKEEVDRIIAANDQQYRSLDCNRDLIKVGWQLQIPRWSPRLPDNGTANRTGDQTGDQTGQTGDQSGGDSGPRCVQRDQGRNYYDQSDRRQIFNIQNAYFSMDGHGGFSIQRPDGPRPQYNGDDRYYVMPPQGDYIPPRYNTSIPPIGLQNGYGWNRGACLSCHDNGNVYLTQPPGWDYNNGMDRGYYWQQRQTPGIFFDLSIGGRRHHNSWNDGRSWQSHNWQGNGWQSYNDGYDGYSFQNVPFYQRNGNVHMRNLLYTQSNGYRIMPVAY